MQSFKKKYCDIMVVYVKISKKHIEVNENYIIVSCFVTYSYLTFCSYQKRINGGLEWEDSNYVTLTSKDPRTIEMVFDVIIVVVGFVD